MDKSLIRSESFLGNIKTIIGDKSSDIVLETLGKVYIKFGNNLKLLNDLFSTLDKSSEDTKISENTIITDTYQELIASKYPGDGIFGFCSNNKTLYMSFGGEWIPILDTSVSFKGDYVKKSGDTMTGQLEIVTGSAPLVVNSTKLVRNLNSDYLRNYSDSDFGKKHLDETIDGKWSFKDKTTFKNDTLQEGNLYCSGSIGTSEFESGYNGYGWKLDATTNTLTIDNLIVRKVMHVYELVVNQISATNGSLWVTNSAKCESAINTILYITTDVDKVKANCYYIYSPLSNNSIKVYIHTSSLFNEDQFEEEYQKNHTDPEDNKKQYNRMEYIYYNIVINKIKSFQELTYVNFTSDMQQILNAELIINYNSDTSETINLYTKYFESNGENYRVVSFKDYPLFKTGDIVRCQKFNGNGDIKYYDALVLTYLSKNTYLIELSKSFNDLYSKVESNLLKSSSPNTLLYSKNSTYPVDTTDAEKQKEVLGDISEGDDIVQIGNIWNIDRQGSIYLTSTDDNGPYIEVLDGVNRPDYSVIIPTNFLTISDGDFKGYYVVPWGNNIPPGSAIGLPLYLYKNGNNISFKDNGGTRSPYAIYEQPNNSCLSTKYSRPSKVRLGKLSGIYNPIFGEKQPKGYGLYGENVFLTGEFYLNNGKSVLDISNDYINISTSVNSLNNITQQLDAWAKGNSSDIYSKIMNEDTTKDLLQTSGLYLTVDPNTKKGQAILYGDQIFITNSFNDGTKPAALFENGKIKANFLELGNLSISKENISKEGLKDLSEAAAIPYTGKYVLVNKGTSLITLSKALAKPNEDPLYGKIVSINLNKSDLFIDNVFVWDTLCVSISSMDVTPMSVVTGTYYFENGKLVVKEGEEFKSGSHLTALALINNSEYHIPVKQVIENKCYLDLTVIEEYLKNSETLTLYLDAVIAFSNPTSSVTGTVGIGDKPQGISTENDSYLGVSTTGHYGVGNNTLTTIGPNGMLVKANDYNYLYMTNTEFIVSIGQSGIKINNDGTYKRDKTTGKWIEL